MNSLYMYMHMHILYICVFYTILHTCSIIYKNIMYIKYNSYTVYNSTYMYKCIVVYVCVYKYIYIYLQFFPLRAWEQQYPNRMSLLSGSVNWNQECFEK